MTKKLDGLAHSPTRLPVGLPPILLSSFSNSPGAREHVFVSRKFFCFDSPSYARVVGNTYGDSFLFREGS